MLENVGIKLQKALIFLLAKPSIFSDKVGQYSDTKNDKRQNQNIDIILLLLLIYKGISEKEIGLKRTKKRHKTAPKRMLTNVDILEL